MPTDEYNAFDPSDLDADPPPKREPDQLHVDDLQQPPKRSAEGSDRYDMGDRVVAFGHDAHEDGRSGYIDVCDEDGTPGVVWDDEERDGYDYVNDSFLYYEP